jgi:phospholipase C
LAFLFGNAVSGCATSGGSAPLPPDAAAQARHAASPIKHVIFIVQENRSFNNLFMSFPGATTATYGYDTTGGKIPLYAQSLASGWDIDHSSYAFWSACDGQGKLPGTECKMDGWNNERASFGHPVNFAYAYTPRSETKPYWSLARQYVLADHMFTSNLDGSFVAHQYIVAAYASRSVDFPASSWGCEGGARDTVLRLTAARTYGSSIRACYDNPTIASEADTASVTWRFYAGGIDGDGGTWSSYQADRKIFYGTDWSSDVIHPPAQFLSDVAAGTLADVTWITPTYETSDHPGLNSSEGPAWVASVVNAVGTTAFWKSTAIFIMWDDWGGWFDPVKPVYEDYDGLGFRVPLIVVSPYARKGRVTHRQYETASVLRYIEDTFGLAPLAQADRRASDPSQDVFNYGQTPRKFERVLGGKPTRYWLQLERSSTRHGQPKTYLGDD